MRVVRVVSVLCLLYSAAHAHGQTFVRYALDGINLTDPNRGTGDADAGDVIRMSFRVEHDGLSYAGGKIEMLYAGVRSGAIAVIEDDFAGFPHDPWEFGREPLFRFVVSDGPADSRRAHNVDVEALGDGVGKITDVNDDFFDFASIPPGLGGLAGAFPLADGEAIFVFDYIYEGGVQSWDAGQNGRARLWRSAVDINGIEVPASSGATFVVSPAPASIGLLGLAGVFAGRRRRGHVRCSRGVVAAASVVAIGSVGGAASGQTFVRYSLDGVNLSDQSRGTDQAAIGDVIRMNLRVEHDGLRFAGGKVEMLYGGVNSASITVTEDDYFFPIEPWVIGRHGILRIVISDGPADATQPHNEDVEAMGDGSGKITDVNDDFIDLASTPPGLGGLAGAFPMADGDAIFIFDYTYDGGLDRWDAGQNGRARLWRRADDINGIEVPASSGATFIVSPAPAGVGVLGLGWLIVGRRRRSD